MQAERTRFEHPVTFYNDLDDFLGVMVPYVGAGLSNGEAVFVAARGDYLVPLKDSIGVDPTAARFVATDEWAPHPSLRLRALHEFVGERSEAGATRFRLAGEPLWPPGPAELVCEWQRHESALNSVFADLPGSLLCLYDSSSLHPSILATARETHPVICYGTDMVPSPDYDPPESFLLHRNLRPPPPPPWADRLEPVENSLARTFIREQAHAAGMDEYRTMELCVAVNEVVTNALVYGSDVGLSAWTEGDLFVCQVQDSGPGIPDPLAGYAPPSLDRQGGRGLWMARHLVDLLQIFAGPEGTIVRLRVDLPGTG